MEKLATYQCSKCKSKAEYQMPVRDARLWDYRCEKHKTPVHLKIATAPQRPERARAASTTKTKAKAKSRR